MGLLVPETTSSYLANKNGFEFQMGQLPQQGTAQHMSGELCCMSSAKQKGSKDNTTSAYNHHGMVKGKTKIVLCYWMTLETLSFEDIKSLIFTFYAVFEPINVLYVNLLKVVLG